MKHLPAAAKAATYASYIAGLIIVLLPFHAFITVFGASFLGHYTLLRLWKEFLLVLVVLAAIYILLREAALFKKFVSQRLIQLILAYTLVLLLAAFIPLVRHDVTAKAMWYGLLIDLRFLIFFMAATVIAAKSDWLALHWRQILLAPAIIVGGIAILQYLVLPYDFLKHFGYKASTIFPYETINHEISRIRVMSTLRGANPLGTYLIVPIGALAVGFFSDKKQRVNQAMFGGGLLLALVFSFSRSAWLGATLSILIAAWLSLKRAESRRLAAWAVAGVLVICGLMTIILRNSTTFQDVFLHTHRNSSISTSSNDNHAAAERLAVDDIVSHPQGGGVGTAGPADFYNPGIARIAENYFLQIGQEAGIIGMALFIAICLFVGGLLYKLRAEPLAMALFVSLIGITFVNLLSHAWTDDTLAYIWWGLAGVALAPILAGRQKANGKKRKT